MSKIISALASLAWYFCFVESDSTSQKEEWCSNHWLPSEALLEGWSYGSK